MISALTLLLAAATSSPSPEPTPTPVAPVTLGAAFTLFGFNTTPNSNFDAEISNALVTISAGAGKVHVNATVGQYSFPGVGFPILPANAGGANTELYSALPLASVQYAFDNHFTLGAGKYATLLGQESDFTYQNLNVQRGIGWIMEPTISRGVQAAYTNGPWSLTAQYNDAYYGGYQRAAEALVAWSPSSATNLQLAFIIPGANAGPNPTTTVGNKAEYDLMFSTTFGKLQILPYFLWVNSPVSAQLGYTHNETAYAGALLANWIFSGEWSAAMRYENAANQSSINDTSPNADLIGFGAGSFAHTYTITPAYRFGNGGVIRLEYSHVGGTVKQDRIGFDLGVSH